MDAKKSYSRNETHIPLVAELSNGDDDNNEQKRRKTKNTSVDASSEAIWDAQTLNNLLVYVDNPPKLYAAEQISDTDAKCTFVHPNGSFVNVELPISRIFYVPAYKSIVSEFDVDTDW